MSANPERGEFDITIKGTTYTLSLKTAALIALQNHFSTADTVANLDDILSKMEAKSLGHLVAGFWAALLKYHPGISYEQAVALLDDCDDWARLAIVFAALIRANRPDPLDVAEIPPQEIKSRPSMARANRRRGTGASGTSKPVASA